MPCVQRILQSPNYLNNTAVNGARHFVCLRCMRQTISLARRSIRRSSGTLHILTADGSVGNDIGNGTPGAPLIVSPDSKVSTTPQCFSKI